MQLAKQQTAREAKKKPGKAKPVRWFVLSDNAEAKKQLEEAAEGAFWTYNCTVAHTKTMNRDAWKCSIVENYLLSECDYLILTAKSTFGYLAKHRNEAEQSNVFPKS